MTGPHREALAVAAAHAARRGDRAAVERLLSMAGGETLTFADASGRRGMWGRLKDRILGHRAQTAEERHRAEHERQAADFDRITVDGTVVSADLRPFYFGEPIYLFSTNVHWIRYERAPESGGVSRTYLLFKNGQEYVYDAVPWPVILREIQTDSPGRGVWGWFREGAPPYRSLYNGRKGKVYSLSAKERRPTVAHVVTWGKKKT